MLQYDELESRLVEELYQEELKLRRESLRTRLLFSVTGFFLVIQGFNLNPILGWITLVGVIAVTCYYIPGTIRLLKNRPSREHFGLK